MYNNQDHLSSNRPTSQEEEEKEEEKREDNNKQGPCEIKIEQRANKCQRPPKIVGSQTHELNTGQYVSSTVNLRKIGVVEASPKTPGVA